MNPNAAQPTSPGSLVSSLWKNRQLIGQMTRRDVVGRYKGSVMGLAWSLLNPVLMLAVYTFVFSVVFKSRWGGEGDAGHESRTQFAVILFVGMIVHTLFSEVLNRSPGLVLQNVNFVKKVVFPLEILPVVAASAALFHAFVSLCVLVMAHLMFNGLLPWTCLFLPIVFLPLLILVAGLSWALASLGTFLRDVGQTIGILTTVLLFLSPVFYPVSALPEQFRPLIRANPLTFIIEQAREVVIWGRVPDLVGLCAYLVVACFVAYLGFFWFQKTRKGFADVL